MQINFLITRKDKDQNRPVFVEIYRYEGNSSDSLAAVIQAYWMSKAGSALINRRIYTICRMFKTTNGPNINMG